MGVQRVRHPMGEGAAGMKREDVIDRAIEEIARELHMDQPFPPELRIELVRILERMADDLPENMGNFW